MYYRIFLIISTTNSNSYIRIPGIPHLKIDSIPSIGTGGEVGGHIEFYDGGNNYTDYRITMALETIRGGQVWAPKPYAGEPSVSIGTNGRFSCLFASGGTDIRNNEIQSYRAGT